MSIIVIAVLFLILIGIVYLIPENTSPILDPNGKHLPGSIASLEKVTLGGKQQWILIRGADIKNPVILFLHGGPGTADMSLLRRYTAELEKHFVIVSWDQRGAGKSFKARHPESEMKIERFVEDTAELTTLLCRKFNRGKIILVGHSWGSVLGVLTVYKYPQLYQTYIGIGQVADMSENELISYEWTLEQARKANDKGIVDKLVKMGKPPYSGDWMKKFITQRRYLGKFGGEMYGSTKGAFPVVFKNLLRCREYSLADKVNFFRGILNTVRLVGPELMLVNLMKLVPELKIPVFFILGRHDHEAPSILAEQYFNSLKAPHKELIWFENSAHLPHVEENGKFNELMINQT